MLALRNPLADRPLAALASLGDWVLVPAMLAGMGWLAWRRRWMAVLHWLAALAFGLALTRMLGATVTVVPARREQRLRLPVDRGDVDDHHPFGFFAMLIARELPGRRRVWPYLLAGTLAAAVGFARLYLGAHWLSDVIGGMLLGVVWLLVLGIASRRRRNRLFWMKPLAWTFYGVFAAAALWYAPRNIDAKLARFEPAAPALAGCWTRRWWNGEGRRALPARRNEFDDAQRWPLDGSRPPLALQARLQAAGWKPSRRPVGSRHWRCSIDAPPADTPVSAAAGHAGGVLADAAPRRAPG
jgi:membrane-associated phospholipid phosphatase